MVAIVTTDTKQILVEKLIEDLQADSNNYYLGIGKSDAWNETDTVPTTITDIGTTRREFRNNLQSIQKIVSVSYVAKRYNWASGTIYQAYNDNQTSTQNGQYYVITESNRVYICLRQGRNTLNAVHASTVNPDTTGTTTSPVTTTDGYVWKFLFTQSATRLTAFSTSNFIPVEKITATTGLSNIQQSQKNVQDAASVGQIVGYRVTSGGTGFTAAPTITVSGNGSNARAVALITGGAVVAVNVDDSANGFPFGAEYDHASISFSGGNGTGLSVEPVISEYGIGTDPRDDLKSTSIMFNSRLVGGAGSGDFLTGDKADFRQVGIIRNPKIPTSRSAADSDFTATTGSALRILSVGSGAGLSGIPVDNPISQGTSDPKSRAFVDKVTGSLTAATILYHQNENTGFLPFSVGGTALIDSATPANTGTILSDSDGEVNPYSGDLLYVESRAAVERTTAGTEDIKITIQF
tara:strand:+ start:234 stop:1628 length:1395 start_codon:yes stop_codon:yes gene_type:complete